MQTCSFAIIDCSEEKFIDDLIIMSILKVEIMLQKPPSKVESYALVMTVTCFYGLKYPSCPKETK